VRARSEKNQRRRDVTPAADVSIGRESPTSPSTGNVKWVGISNWLLRRVAEKTVVMEILIPPAGLPAARHRSITVAAGSRTCCSCEPAGTSAQTKARPASQRKALATMLSQQHASSRVRVVIEG
jgi:hypothetical protein